MWVSGGPGESALNTTRANLIRHDYAATADKQDAARRPGVGVQAAMDRSTAHTTGGGGGKTQHSRKGGMAGWLTGPDKYLGRDTGPPPPGRFAGFGSSKQDHSSPVPNRANLKPMDSSSSKRGTFGAAMSAAPVRGEGERGGRRK